MRLAPPAHEAMKTATSTRIHRRVALLLNWRMRGYFKPPYGLVDDEELLRTGSATFLSGDGRQVVAQRNELLLLFDA